MTPLKDKTGAILPGAFRTKEGGIVFVNKAKHAQYLKQRDSAINTIRQQDMQQKIDYLLELLSKKDTNG